MYHETPWMLAFIFMSKDMSSVSVQNIQSTPQRLEDMPDELLWYFTAQNIRHFLNVQSFLSITTIYTFTVGCIILTNL